MGEITQGMISNSQKYSPMAQVRIEHVQGMGQVIHEPTGYPEAGQVIHEPTLYAEGMRVIKDGETSEDQESREREMSERGECHMKVGW